jgi:CBS-domain-containing membrane protein
MDIHDTVVEDIPETSADSRMGTIRGMFNGDFPKGVVVMKDGSYAGIVHEKKLVNSYISDDTKAITLTESAPHITQNHDIRQAAKMLVEAGVKIAPFMSQSGEIEGVVTHNSMLGEVVDSLDVLNVEDVYTEDVITESTEGTLGEVISLIRTNGVSRIPIEDEDGDLKGIITTQDVVSIAVRSAEKPTEGNRMGDGMKITDLPLTNIMSSPVRTCKKSDSLDEAVQDMLDANLGGLVVSEDGKSVDGIMTKTDAVRALKYEDEHSLPVQITNVNLMDSLDRDTIRRQITSVVDKYEDMDVQFVHVRFHKEKSASRRGEDLISCTVRLNTNKSQIAGSGEGYGSKQAFEISRDKLERNVLEVKGMNDPSEYEDEVLRDMSDY